MSVSDNGQFVAFTSDADNLVSGDDNGTSDVFVRDLSAGTTELVSVDTGGDSDNGRSFGPVISADGSTIAFQSWASDLVSGDFNNRDEAFAFIRNSAPTADAGGPHTVDEGGNVQFDASATTDDEQSTSSLTYEWDLDGDGTFGESGETGIDPTFSAAGLDGPTSVTVELRVTDDSGLTATDTATIDVDNVAPTAGNDPATVAEDGSVSLDVLANDSDPASVNDPLTIASAISGSHGSVTVAADGKSLTYAPDPDFNGSDSFTYIVEDGDGGSDTSIMVYNDGTSGMVPVSLTHRRLMRPTADTTYRHRSVKLEFPTSSLLGSRCVRAR